MVTEWVEGGKNFRAAFGVRLFSSMFVVGALAWTTIFAQSASVITANSEVGLFLGSSSGIFPGG